MKSREKPKKDTEHAGTARNAALRFGDLRRKSLLESIRAQLPVTRWAKARRSGASNERRKSDQKVVIRNHHVNSYYNILTNIISH